MVDRGRGDPRNVIGVIVDRSDNNMYTTAVKSGMLRTKYSRNEFDICPQRLLSQTDVNQQDRLSLRQALKSSATGGQGQERTQELFPFFSSLPSPSSPLPTLSLEVGPLKQLGGLGERCNN